MNLFCLLSIRSAVAELLKPLVGERKGRKEKRQEGKREEGEWRKAERDTEYGALNKPWPCVV